MLQGEKREKRQLPFFVLKTSLRHNRGLKHGGTKN